MKGNNEEIESNVTDMKKGPPFCLGNEILEEVDEYNYHGQAVTAGRNHERYLT